MSVLALDIGGTSCRVGLFSDDLQEEDRFVLATDAGSLPVMVNAVTQELEVRRWRYDTVGIGVAGNVDTEGVLLGSGNLPGWKGQSIVAAFSSLGSVTVLNDCAAAALGEASSLKHSLVYFIWGTGVGVAAVSVAGDDFTVSPTELGHMVVDCRSDVACGCGGFGHLEALIGGRNLERRFGVAVSEMSNDQWSEVIGDAAVGLRNISSVYVGLPIVLGGGVATKQAHRLVELQKEVSDVAMPTPIPELHLAVHGEDSGLIGAAQAARSL